MPSNTPGLVVNTKKVLAAGVGIKPWVKLNQGRNVNVSLNLIVTGAATFDVEGTLMRVDEVSTSGEAELEYGTPGAEDVFGISGATGLTASTSLNIANTPLGGVRINQTAGAGSVTLHVMSQGA